jgi:hypothetical protein
MNSMVHSFNFKFVIELAELSPMFHGFNNYEL